MERHPKQIHVRMSEAEIGRAKRLAADANRGSATQQRSDAPQPMRQNEQQKRREDSER